MAEELREKRAKLETVVPLSLLECAVCLGLINEPISLSCGHSFCRVCLIQTLSRTRKKCPSCRAVCYNTAELYQERSEEMKKVKSSLKATFPVFYYNMPLYPGEKLMLHLFEPRYRIMIKRIINTSRRFAYVPNYTNYCATIGDIALIAEITDCNIEADGRCNLIANLTRRQYIVDHYVEDGTHGLHFCQVQKYDDKPLSKDEVAHAETMVKQLEDIFRRVWDPMWSEVVSKHGEMPPSSQIEIFSLYIAGVLPCDKSIKQEMLECRSTIQRLKKCLKIIKDMRDLSVNEVLTSLSSR